MDRNYAISDLIPGSTPDTSATMHECRRCGTTLDEARDDCPECGSEEIAHIEFACDCSPFDLLLYANACVALARAGTPE